MRLRDKVAIVVGAGQSPGEGLGNGRATALLFAREAATVLLVDRDTASLAETARMIDEEHGKASVLHADITLDEDCRAIAACCLDRYGRIDVLHNNVGVATGDGSLDAVEPDAWRRIIDTNLTSMMLTTKHVLPAMRDQRSGCITNISSIASIVATPVVAYKVSKAGVDALTQHVAMANAEYGIRCNAILPGLVNTPMALEAMASLTDLPREEVIRLRDARVPLLGKMGSAWDVARVALFLASEDARFITGVLLPVDGGQRLRTG